MTTPLTTANNLAIAAKNDFFLLFHGAGHGNWMTFASNHPEEAKPVVVAQVAQQAALKAHTDATMALGHWSRQKDDEWAAKGLGLYAYGRGTFEAKEEIRAAGGKWDPLAKVWRLPRTEAVVEAAKSWAGVGLARANTTIAATKKCATTFEAAKAATIALLEAAKVAIATVDDARNAASTLSEAAKVLQLPENKPSDAELNAPEHEKSERTRAWERAWEHANYANHTDCQMRSMVGLLDELGIGLDHPVDPEWIENEKNRPRGFMGF